MSFNFAPNKFKNVTVREIIQKIHRNWTIIKPVFQKVKGKNIESKLLQLNPSKSKKFLNWQSVLTLDETISYTIDWYKYYYENKKIYNFSKKKVESYFKLANKKHKWKIDI